ncbi:hypothetical protein LCGC14_0535680 [marine sediment metagenome]|uniref:Uncharacterized protein n=1 Tax=marine sediment metagenome TaxID=412755 RepID=A0A0F9RYZ2_9ZZZZ
MEERPGSDEAIKQGCRCPVMDNQVGVGGMFQRPVIYLDCPVHGDKPAPLLTPERPTLTEDQFHRVWTEAVGREGYSKALFQEVLTALQSNGGIAQLLKVKRPDDLREKLLEYFWDAKYRRSQEYKVYILHEAETWQECLAKGLHPGVIEKYREECKEVKELLALIDEKERE